MRLSAGGLKIIIIIIIIIITPRLVEYQLRLGFKGGNVTCRVAGNTMRSYIWHVGSRSDVACCLLLCPVTLLIYFTGGL